MIATMLLLFVVGYGFIAFEGRTKVDKAAVALLLCGVLWSLLSLGQTAQQPPLEERALDDGLLRQLGSTCEILIFLIAAMTVVNMIDFHGGFDFITHRITTRRKVALLWLVALLTFFMSALLDNMTTTIVMVMLLRRLVADPAERLLYVGMVVIAANSGGAWSPIGDVTTIMLWMGGNVSAARLVASLILPCLVSMIVPLLIVMRQLRGRLPAVAGETEPSHPDCVSGGESRAIFIVGALLLLGVPVFKEVTRLPPYMGMILALALLWIYVELIYRRRGRDAAQPFRCRIAQVLERLDMGTILFFLGILMAVGALESAGILKGFASELDTRLHNAYLIGALIGLLSSVIDNVPLVAASMGMYPIDGVATVGTAAAMAADPSYTAAFAVDGPFWHLLAYCAGVGGSLLVIGSAAGVVAMGLERIDFMWYLRRISLLALAGYLAGIGTFLLEVWLIGF